MPHSGSSEASADIELPDAPPVKPETAFPSSAPEEDAVDLIHTDDAISKDLKAQLFDDDGDDFDDDELTQLSSQMGFTGSSGVEPLRANYSDPDLTRAYYSHLFPFQSLFHWLNHGTKPSKDFTHREFAFTICTADGKEAYVRYLSYLNAVTFRKDVIKQNPLRFEIGPVYSANPREKKQLKDELRPKSKELCFDLDITDYIDVRTCCAPEDKNICGKCWQWAVMALKVIDAALREDFGFKHILWVYSGRRGIHAWVCDPSVRNMDDVRRRAITGYLEVVKGGSSGGKRVNVRRPLHMHLARSLEILKEHFQTDILRDQDPWQDEQRVARLLELIPDRKLRDGLKKKWDSAPDRSSKNKWADIDALAKAGSSKTLDSKALLEAKQDIVLEYTYARIDAEVGKKLNHLLKSPFVIHPGTGRVCVPIDPQKLDTFDPLTVPTITELLVEIDRWNKTHPDHSSDEGARRTKDYEKTSLKEYVEYFKSFVATLVNAEKPLKQEGNGIKAEPMSF